MRHRDSVVLGKGVRPEKWELVHQLRGRMTPAAQRLWRVLRGNGLHGYHFRRQQLLEGYIADFYCHSARLVVELDGPIHTERAAEDAARDNVLGLAGAHVLRFSNDEVLRRLPHVLARIHAACRT
jgi:very-short-patch-repair endonuclease